MIRARRRLITEKEAPPLTHPRGFIIMDEGEEAYEHLGKPEAREVGKIVYDYLKPHMFDQEYHINTDDLEVHLSERMSPSCELVYLIVKGKVNEDGGLELNVIYRTEGNDLPITITTHMSSNNNNNNNIQ